MAEVIFKIEGMSCQHCVMSVKKAIDGIEGVTSSDVAVGNARVVYEKQKTNREAISQAIQNAGYKVTA
jgi:copper chaperone